MDDLGVDVYLQNVKLDKECYPELHLVANAFAGEERETLLEILKRGYQLRLVGVPRENLSILTSTDAI